MDRYQPWPIALGGNVVAWKGGAADTEELWGEAKAAWRPKRNPAKSADLKECEKPTLSSVRKLLNGPFWHWRNQWLGYSNFWTQLSDGMWLGLVRARMCFYWAELCVVLKLEVTLPKSTQYSEIVEIIVNQPLPCKGYCARVHCRPIFECFGPVSMKRGLQPCTAKDRFASAPDATPKILMVSQAGRITQVLQDFSIPSL